MYGIRQVGKKEFWKKMSEKVSSQKDETYMGR
jgi:hypothetical protein